MAAAWVSPAALLHPSRVAVNTAIWAIGIVLQLALVYAIFRRGVARNFWGFAILAVFYPLRSALLFALNGRIDNDDYSTLSSALSLTEAPLQVFLAIQIWLRSVRRTGGWWIRRIAWAALLLCAPFMLTALTMNAMPAHTEVDRVPLFMGFVMLVLFAAIVKDSRSANALRISGGYSFFALAQLAAIAGRAHAMLYRDTPAYLAWGYLPAVSYLAVVLFWILALKREERPASETPQRARLEPAATRP